MLLTDPGKPAAGGLFYLASKPSEDLSALDGSWQVDAPRDSSVVVAKGGIATCYEDAFEESLAAAQRGLDLFSFSNFANLSIRDFTARHIVWWLEGNLIAMRIVLVSALRMSITIEAKVTEASGTIRQISFQPTSWHNS